jgi:glycosyltransferase involved in cell wall biosynthesis
MTLAIVIPAYQARRHIRGVLERISATGVPELSRVIVVDDGSRDAISEEVSAMHHFPCALECMVRERNGGYGAAMKDGISRARERGATVVACVHADGQYAPESLPSLLTERSRRELDVLQGSRIASGTALRGGMPYYKYVANAALNLLENRTLGLALSDYHSGYLIYGPRALASLPFANFSDSFDFDLEVIAAACAHGFRVAEAPVPTHYGDEVSHLNPISYGLRVLRVLLKYRRGRYAPV